MILSWVRLTLAFHSSPMPSPTRASISEDLWEMQAHDVFPDDSSRRTWAAALQVLQLRTSLGLVEGSSTPMSLNGREMSAKGIITALTDMLKPLDCRASVRFGRLDITCTTITEPGLLAVMNTFGEEGLQFGSAVRRGYCRGNGAPKVLVRTNLDTLVVPLSAVEDLYRDYRFRGSVHSEPPDDEAVTRGACAVVVLGPTYQVKYEASGDSGADK